MGVQFITVKCPECGATLNIEENRHQAFCSYCGSKVLINNDNEYIYRTIDEARIKESEINQALKLKEMELQEKERERNRKTRFYKIIASIILGIVGAICFIFSEFGDIDSMNIFFLGYIAIFAILFIWLSDISAHNKDKNK